MKKYAQKTLLQEYIELHTKTADYLDKEKGNPITRAKEIETELLKCRPIPTNGEQVYRVEYRTAGPKNKIRTLRILNVKADTKEEAIQYAKDTLGKRFMIEQCFLLTYPYIQQSEGIE